MKVTLLKPNCQTYDILCHLDDKNVMEIHSILIGVSRLAMGK